MRTTFYHQFYWAITEFPFYKTILAQPLRQTLLYLLYLCAHASLIVTCGLRVSLGTGVSGLREMAPGKRPSHAGERGPAPNRGGPAADPDLLRTAPPVTLIFDTTGSRQDLTRFPGAPCFSSPKTPSCCARTRLWRPFPWTDFGSFEVTPELIRDWLELMKWVYFPTAYSLVLVFTFAIKLVLALFFTLLALSVTTRYQVKFSLSGLSGYRHLQPDARRRD